MLRIKDLTKRYRISKKKIFTALDHVSLDIVDEKMVAIIGESGSGKSTLMNLISTIDSPNGGYVEYDGKKITFNGERKKAAYRRENIGFVFQSFNLLKDLTAIENVEIVMEIAGIGKAERHERAKELLTIVGLGEMINKKPGTLSGGQKQRVAIARALANDPDLILADEPTGSLDHNTSIEIMKLLSTIANSGKKVVIVTHDMNVASYCERIIAMEDGKVVSDKQNDCELLDTIEIPKSLKGGLTGLKLSGVLKLSQESFKRKFKRNLLISIGTAVSIASLLLVSVATGSIKGYLRDVESLYGNPDIIKLNIYKFDQTGIGMGSSEDILAEAEEQYRISEYEHIKERIDYDFDAPFDYYEITLEDGTYIRQKRMYPQGIQTFGTDDLINGEAPQNENEIAISGDLIDMLNYDSNSIIGQTIKLKIVVGDNGEMMPFGGDVPVVEVDTTMGETDGIEVTVNSTGDEPGVNYAIEEGVDIDPTGAQTEVEVVTEEFVVTGVLTDSSIRGFGRTIYFTEEYAKQYETEYDFATGIYDELIIVEEGYADDFIEYIMEAQSGNFASGVYVNALKDLELIMILGFVVDGVFVVFSIILGISVFVAAIMIAVMSYVSILERIREVGVLRSVGAKKSDITKMFLHESTTIGLLSGIIAVILGVGLSFIAIAIVNSQLDSSVLDMNISVVVSVKAVVVTIVGAILLSIISSVISIFLGLRVSPAEALRRK